VSGGFTGYDQVINAWTVNGTGQKLQFSKISATAGVANTPMDMWKATGMPAAGAYGTVGKANGRVTTSATAGGLPYNNPSAGQTCNLLEGEATGITASATGSLILVDFIADVLLDYSETTGSIVGVDATSRLPANAGAQLWLPVVTGLSAVANTWTFGYTNNAGVSSRVTPTITGVASRAADKNITAGGPWQPLQAGDTGIRTLDTITHASGAGTGQFAAKLIRILANIPIGTIGIVVARDFVVELPNMERIYDNSCLGFLWLPTGTQTPTYFGEVRVASN
jgi:hypothetical protein